ncbi:DNA polymerase zeta catalytic subunit [Araneus ventricosus]|uniref:DNA polymerase zeta catalytic subunit n=1 Tax=Araneus ventricosus TaxID=182803 RepID=A0A4Y2JLH1_ARAVE|nr:DNA polymerase zeta catalytic subunit [Araneus ventricosus]
MFSLRILTVDSYQSSPISGYDDCYSDFRGCEIYNVPVLTLFGTTHGGQKGALHVHGVFPYLYLRWNDVFPGVSTSNCRKYLQELALEIDKALNVEAAKSNSNKHHVHNITIEKKRSIYGFYAEAEDFLKILFYYPWDTSRVAALLYRQSILNKFIQPYEAHFPYGFQFFVDYNLFGMNTININAFKFRSPNGDASPSRTPRGMSSFLSRDSPSYCQIWNVASLSSSQVNNIPKRVVSELEVDCRVDAILNKYGLLYCMDSNPGLVEIREDLKRQRRLANETSQMTPIPTQERDVEVTESELFYKGLLMKIIERKKAAEESLMNENNESGAINDSQRSFTQSSSESFGLSNTQDNEMLKMLVNMCKDHGPEDDSILAAKIDSESDDDEVTNEMSQQFVDDILNAHWSSQNTDSQNPMHSSNVFHNSMDAEIPSGSQQDVQIPQVDGAYDDENFENGPRLLKQENVNVNTEFNEEPPVLHPIPPLESFELEQDWMMHCSVKVTDIGTVDSSRPIPLADLANGSNARPKSKKLHVPVAKKSGLSKMIQNEQMQRKKMTVDPSVGILLKDLISKIVEENESTNSGSKASNNYLQMDSKPNLSKSDKTSKPNADCFFGARPKTKNNIYSSVDKVSANNSESPSSKSTTWNDLVKTSEQVKFTDSSPMVSPSSFKHSTDLRPKVKNGEFKVNSKPHTNTVCFDKKKNYGLHPSSSNDKSSKESTSSKEMLTCIDNKSKKKDKNYVQNEELSNSDLTKLKKSSNDHSEFHSSPSESPCTKSSNLEQSFNVVKSIQSVNFAKVGHEAVLLKMLTEKDIAKFKSGHSEIVQNVHLISEQISNESKKSEKGMKDERKRYKIYDRNKLKSASLNEVDNLVSKESSKVKSDSTINKEHLLSERHSGSIENSKKYFADSDHTGSMQVSSKIPILDNTDFKESKNISHSLNNVTSAFCPSEISDKKQPAFNKNSKNSSFNNGMLLAQGDAHCSGPKAPSSHHSTVPLINAKEPDDAIAFKSVFKSDVRNQENMTKSSQSSGSASSLTTSAFASNLKPECQKSLKRTDHKANSKHKHSKKDKRSARRRVKKVKSAYHSDKKLNGKYQLFKPLEYDNDFKNEPEAAFKNSLHERNVDYYPKAKAMSPGIKPLINSATKMLGSEPNLNNNVIKPRTVSSLQKITVPTETDKINRLFGSIIENSLYVNLVDCRPLIEKYYPENLPLLLKKNTSLQSKGHRKFSSSKVFSESETKKFHVSRKGGGISSAGCSNKNQIKRLTNKPKKVQFASSAGSKVKNQEYPKLDVFSLPAKSKVGVPLLKTSVDVLPFPGKSKSAIDLKLEARSTPSNVLHSKTDSQDILPFAVKSKPSHKSRSMTDLNSNSELSGRFLNQNIKTNKSDEKNNLHSNYASCELSPTEIVNEAKEDKSASKSAYSTFSDCISNHTKKPSSNKNSKFRFNNRKLVNPDCIVVGEVKSNETSENKMLHEPKENLHRGDKSKIPTQCEILHKGDKNEIPTQCIVNEDNDFKSSLSDTPIKDVCNFSSQALVRNKVSDTVLEKTTAVKPSRETRCKPSLISSNSLDNSVITTNDLYDTVKRRTASKNQLDSKLSLKPDFSRPLNNNKPGKVFPASSRTKTSRKNLATSRNDFSSVPNAKSVPNFTSVCEKEDSLSLLEGKDSIFVSGEKTVPGVENSASVSKTEKSFSFPNKNQCHMKQETVLIANDMTTDSTSLSGPSKIAEDTALQNTESEQKSPVASTSNEFLHTDIPATSNALHPIPVSSNGNQSGLLPHTVSACGSHPSTNSKSILSRPKGRASKMSGISNNFGFFSNKTPQRNRRCQNDPESLQFPKPMSSRLSLKLNKKNDFSNERKDSTSQQDSKKPWKIDSTLLENSNSQGCSKLTNSETNSNQQSSETCILPQNVIIKTEPVDDYEENNRNPDISDALKRFDFDESSSSDPASYTFSHSKRTRNQKNQITQQSKLGINASKIQSSAHCSSSGFSEANKSDFHLNASSVSLCNNNPTNDRYPKRNRSVSSTVDDDVVILDEAPSTSSSTSRRTRRSSRLLSNNNTGPKEVIDLEKEDVCMNVAPVITIKRDREGNNSIVPNKRCSSFTNNVSKIEDLADAQPSMSSSTYNYAADSSDALGSRNSVDDLLSSPDSKHGLRLRLKLKTILTRNNEPKIVVVGKQLDGENDQESDSNVQNHSEVTIKAEGGSEMKSSKTRRTLGVRSSKRKSKTSPDEQYVPPLLIKDIKVEKEDDYEKPYVQPLKFSLSSISATQTDRPSTSFEPKCEPLKLYRRSNNFYVESNGSNKRKLPNTTDESSDNGTEVLPKRRRGRPAKIHKSVRPENDLSPLKNNTSFNENLSPVSATYQIPKTSAADQPLDIGRRCSFPVSDNIEECSYEKVGPNLNFDWVKVKIKQEILSDYEDAGKVDNNINANSISPLENNISATTSRRRNSLRCESFKKFFDSASDDDAKPKSGPKPQKKKTRSKSANTESNMKTVEHLSEISSSSSRRTRTRSGSFKKYFNGDKGGNSSDSDCKVVGANIAVKTKQAPRRRRGRPPLSRNRQLSSDALPPCNPCSVTLERLSPSLLEQGNSSRKTRRMSNVEASNRPNLNSALNSGIQIVPELNSNVAPSCLIQNNGSSVVIPSPIGNDITVMNQHVLNSEKSDFEVLHNKVMGEKISPVLQPSPDKNPCTKFIPDSGPVTINGLNSIDIDSDFSELLCEKEISGNKLNCSSFMYNSSLNPDSNILSNRNSANFLRPPSHEMDQRVFESPSNVLKSGSMDCQSPLLYSHSPITDAKHISEFSPDNKFLHLNHSSPQAYKRQQELIHSPVMNPDPMFDHCNSPLKEVIIANNKNESLKTPEKDFSRTVQQRDVSTYYSNSSDSYNEGCRTDPSVIPKSKTKGNIFTNVASGIPDHASDFSKGQQHSSPYSFENNSVDQNGELPFCTTKGFGNYDKISNNQHDSLKYLGNNFSGRKESMSSCFPSNYSESRKQLPSIPEQTRPACEESNRENSHYSGFSSSYGSPVGVQQQQQPYSTHNQTSFNNSFHQRTDESLNSFRNHNEYYDRMKWEDLNVSNFSNTNDSYSEDCKSPFSAQQSRYDSYYTKNNNDLNGSSRMNNDPYYRQKWSEVNTPYFPHSERSLNEFSQNDKSLDEFSLNDRSVNDTFRCRPPEVQPESSKYDSSYPNINSQASGSSGVSTSSGAFDRTKSVDVNFSHFSTFDCNPSEPKEFQNTMGKKFENTFDKNMEVFFNHHGFSSTSSEIQSPSSVSHASPQLGTNSSPFRVDSKIVFNKKMDFNSESNEAGRKYMEVCKPSPCSSLSDHMDSVQSPSLINNSPLCAPNRPVSVIEEFKVQEIMEKLSSPCIENVDETKNSPEVYDKKTQSPNSSREVLTMSSDSCDTMSECNTVLKSPDSLSKNTKTSSKECEQDVKTFDMTLDSVQEDSFDLLSDQMISEDDSFLMDDNIFTTSPQNKVDESVPISVDSNDIADACDIPKTTSTEISSAQSTEADQTSLNYIDCDVQILNFQECLTESDPVMHPFLGDLSFDFLSQDSNSITNEGNDSNTCVAATDVSVKDDLSDSAQIANKTQNNNGCPLFVGTVPNVNVIVTNPPSSISDSPNSFVPLESLKNSIMPVITVNNSAVNETVCYTQPSTSSAFNPINPAFLSTLMVNESVVLPQSNFFFNNGSIIIGDGSSVEQGCINVFQNSDTDKNYSVTSVSEVDSKDSQEVQNLKKSFNGEDDILSMIVKSCDIGEEFDENFDSPVESLNNADVAEPSSIHSASDSFDGASNLNTTLETNSIPNSFPVNSMEKITTSSQNLPSGCEQKGESTVLSYELPNKINEYKSKENHSPSVSSSPNQSLESSQDKDNIHQSAALDSMIHSFYGEDTLYGLNASGNCDSLSLCSSVQSYDTSLNKSNKNKWKSVTDDFPERYNKDIAIISPSQSSSLPGNGNRTLIAKTRIIPIENGSNRQRPLNLNDKLETKRAADSTSDETNEVDPTTMFVKPNGSPPHYVRIVVWVDKPGEASPTCSSPESSSSQKSESPQVQPQPFSPSDNQSVQSTPSTVSRQLMITPTSRTDHGVLRQLLSKGVTLESTPSVHRQYNKTRILDGLLLSPISKDNLLTNDTKRKRKLPFDGSPEQSELPESKILKEVHERSWKKSFMADQSKDIVGNLTSSEIDGPTLINSQNFRINIEDCERVRHEAQHLTIMSLEIHVNTRNTLSPDPVHDPVAVIFYTIYNEMEVFQQKVVGIIALDKQPENSGLRSTHTSLTNYLNLVPGVKTCDVTCVEDEKLLFEKLACVVREWDPDILVGYEIQMASWGYLIERANVLKMNLISMLSRLCSEKKETKAEQALEDRTVTDQTADTDRINIPGRIVLNVWRLMRKEITLNVYTFENVYYHVLHKRTPRYSFHDLTQWYCGQQKETVVRYYAVRIMGTIQILDKLDLIQRTSELARLFGIQFYEVLSRGSQFRVESMMRRTASQMGFVCVSPSVQQRSHSRAPECVPLILEPLSMFYDDPIIVLDFQSLYPSIIIAFNICFSTCLGRVEHFGKDVPSEFGCTSLNVPLALLQKLVNEDNIHFLPPGIAFVKSDVRRGILPTMLEEILDTRVMVKQFMKKIKNINDLKQLLKQFEARQQGLKLLANTTYGYTGASFSGRMPCVEVADSIVAKARETLERAIWLIENTPKWRAKVVYGDTDSLFVHLPGRTKAEAFKIGQEMADAVTKTNPKPVKLKFEKVYLPCVLQTKKRYVGFMYETADQKRPIFDAKGIETVRRDSCPATAKILEKSLKILFETHDVNSVKSYVQKQFRKVMNGRINLMDFIFAKEYRGLSGYRRGACVPALEIAKRRLNKDSRSEPRTGERVPYVVVYGLPGSPIIRLVHEPGDLLMNPSLRINATYYITRVISPPLERVFSLMGANVKTWYTAIAHTQKLNLPMSHYPRETITQYFVTRNCPSCDCPTTSSLCDNCHQDRAGTAADLQDKIRKWERAVNRLNQICVSCTKSNSSVDHCTSMDCPVLFKLNLAKKDFSQAPYLRKILTHELF